MSFKIYYVAFQLLALLTLSNVTNASYIKYCNQLRSAGSKEAYILKCDVFFNDSEDITRCKSKCDSYGSSICNNGSIRCPAIILSANEIDYIIFGCFGGVALIIIITFACSFTCSKSPVQGIQEKRMTYSSRDYPQSNSIIQSLETSPEVAESANFHQPGEMDSTDQKRKSSYDY